jgi:hypothetical protein
MFTDKQEYHVLDNNIIDNISEISDNDNDNHNHNYDNYDILDNVNKADYYFINIFYTNFFLVFIIWSGSLLFFLHF